MMRRSMLAVPGWVGVCMVKNRLQEKHGEGGNANPPGHEFVEPRFAPQKNRARTWGTIDFNRWTTSPIHLTSSTFRLSMPRSSITFIAMYLPASNGSDTF